MNFLTTSSFSSMEITEQEEMNGIVRTDLSLGSLGLDREQTSEQKANSLNL